MTNYDNLEPVNRVPDPPMKRWKVRIKLADVVVEVFAIDSNSAEMEAIEVASAQIMGVDPETAFVEVEELP